MVAFCALMHFPHPKVKNLRRVHRVVVLPDYQGLGIFRTLIRVVAGHKKAEGYRVSIVSSNPMLAQALKKDPAWALQRQGRVSGGHERQTIPALRATMSHNRLTHTWEYIGQ